MQPSMLNDILNTLNRIRSCCALTLLKKEVVIDRNIVRELWSRLEQFPAFLLLFLVFLIHVCLFIYDHPNGFEFDIGK